MANKGKKQRIIDHAETHVVLTKYPARNVFTLIVAAALTVLFTGWIWAGMRSRYALVRDCSAVDFL